jgi:hypothetical protein
MNVNMKSHYPRFTVSALAGAFLATSVAFAGFQTERAVVIYDAGRTAWGNPSFAHNSPDTAQWILCQVDARDGGYCLAQDATRVQRVCTTSDPNMGNTLRSLTAQSYLTFSWNAQGQCTYIWVENDSTTPPKR